MVRAAQRNYARMRRRREERVMTAMQGYCSQCQSVLSAVRLEHVIGAGPTLQVTIAPFWVLQCEGGCVRRFVHPNFGRVFLRALTMNVPIARLHSSLFRGVSTRCWRCRHRLTGVQTRPGTLVRPSMLVDVPAPGNERVTVISEGPLVTCSKCGIEQIYDRNREFFNAVSSAFSLS